MEMKDLLVKVISDYENILKTVSLKLDELKTIAKENSIDLEVKKEEVKPVVNSFAASFEKQRQAMVDQINKMKEDAKRQAQQAMDEAAKIRNQVPMQMPTMPSIEIPVVPTIVTENPDIQPEVVETPVVTTDEEVK